MLAVGYARVRTEEQAQTGIALDVQEEKIGASCVARDLQLTGTIPDKGLAQKTSSARLSRRS